MSRKRKTSTSKKHVSSDEEDNLTISDEDVEFLDQGVVKKVKKPSARLRKVNSNTPCWKFFEIWTRKAYNFAQIFRNQVGRTTDFIGEISNSST